MYLHVYIISIVLSLTILFSQHFPYVECFWGMYFADVVCICELSLGSASRCGMVVMCPLDNNEMVTKTNTNCACVAVALDRRVYYSLVCRCNPATYHALLFV